MAFNAGMRSFKHLFFNKEHVANTLSKFEQKALSKFGSFVRRRMKSSIKKAPKINVATGEVTMKRKGVALRDAVSKPGDPPYGHEGSLRRLIFFTYDPVTRNVVIGPVKFGTTGAPPTLEGGGPTTIREPVKRPKRGKAGPAQSATFKRLVKAGRIKVPPREFTRRQITVRPRPFVKPAGDEEVRRFPQTLRSL